ncbi:MAG: hypothetical protein ACWGN1_05555 [Desulfobulbales bacterium]
MAKKQAVFKLKARYMIVQKGRAQDGMSTYWAPIKEKQAEVRSGDCESN